MSDYVPTARDIWLGVAMAGAALLIGVFVGDAAGQREAAEAMCRERGFSGAERIVGPRFVCTRTITEREVTK